MKKLLTLFAFAALAIATAAQSHRLKLYQDSVVAGSELKAGDYMLTVEDNKVVISNGKNEVEATVKVETADSKFNSTSIRYLNGDGKYKVREIRIGGTATKLVFEN
ncbi:MAG: hypothetical protein FJW20_13840 [Acidimicrobiia bacterium]|nr:hypothetical protein [Acidimicrobiia bacterium]